MDTNHTRFLAAMERSVMVRIRFRRTQNGRVVERICAPVHFGAEPGSPQEADPRYWIWDFADRTALNPIDVLPEDLVGVRVLDRTFDPASFRSFSEIASLTGTGSSSD